MNQAWILFHIKIFHNCNTEMGINISNVSEIDNIYSIKELFILPWIVSLVILCHCMWNIFLFLRVEMLRFTTWIIGRKLNIVIIHTTKPKIDNNVGSIAFYIFSSLIWKIQKKINNILFLFPTSNMAD